jgi:alcohol dehydrogenase class IV
MIGAFTFNTSQRIVFENGAAETLASHAASFLGPRPFLVTDPGIVSLGLQASCEAALTGARHNLARFSDVVADPPRSLVDAAVDAARAHGATSVIGFGGGSSLDVAKLVALLLGSEEDLDDAWGIGNAKGPRLPLILVPTTAGTGSEVTPISIITVGEEEKRGVVSPLLLPDLAILDPLLTLGLPGPVTAATGIDAMVHAIEGYASKSANNNPVSRTLAIEALKLLGANIEKAVFTPDDTDARGAMLLGSMLAGMAFANSPVAAVHALAYPIGGTFHVPHGLSNALVLPHVLKFNNAVASETYAEIAPTVFPELSGVSDARARSDLFAEHLADLAVKLGLQTRLRDVGISEADLPKLASDAMKQTRLLVNNPREMGEADVFDIYKAAL